MLAVVQNTLKVQTGEEEKDTNMATYQRFELGNFLSYPTFTYVYFEAPLRSTGIFPVGVRRITLHFTSIHWNPWDLLASKRA